MIEARVEGKQPIAVTNQHDTCDQAVGGALGKLAASLDTVFARMRSH